MCLAVYLGTEQPVALSPWHHGASLGTRSLAEAERAVCRHMGRPEVQSIVAWEGCACGFKHGTWPVTDDEDRENERRAIASMEELAAVLRPIVEREGRLQLYACWMGDEALEVQSRRSVTLQHFESDAFEFKQRELLDVTA